MHTLPFLVVMAFLAACEGLPDQNVSDLPDWSDGFENPPSDSGTTGGTTGTNPAPPDTEFNVSVPNTVHWPSMLRRWDPETGQVFPDEPCAIDLSNVSAGASATENCIFEQNEGDLYLQNMQLATHVPKDFCDYLFLYSYTYQTRDIGYGPTEVSYTETVDGGYINEVNSVEGAPYCPYAPEGAPNCCLGSYTLTVTGADGSLTTTEGRWGGEDHIGQCYDGASYLYEAGDFAPNDLPIIPFFYIDQAEFDTVLAWSSPSNHQDRTLDGYGTNLGLANYVDLADHDGQLPISLRPDILGVVHPNYQLVCSDNALEKYGIINITVREWNALDELLQDGDPNSNEGYQETSDPLQDWDDLADWRNFGLNGFNERYVGDLD